VSRAIAPGRCGDLASDHVRNPARWMGFDFIRQPRPQSLEVRASFHVVLRVVTMERMIRKAFPVRTRNMLAAGLMLFLGCNIALCQQSLTLPDAPQPQQWKAERGLGMSEYRQHHIMWLIPNYRSDEGATEFHPLMPDQKFKLAFDDSFDPTAFLVAGVFAGSSMAQDQYRSFGQGAKGFSKYYGGAFADETIGNMMTEGTFPTILHQDSRPQLRSISAGKKT
jgi:hypothetical protein